MRINHDQLTIIATDVINEHLQGAKEHASRYTERTSQIWRDLAFVIASQSFSLATKNHRLLGTLTEGQLKRVQQVLFTPQFGEPQPSRFSSNLGNQLEFIRKGRGNKLPVSIACDLYVEDRVRARRYVFMIVAPQPTWLRCKVAKEELLKLLAMKPAPVDGAYFAVPLLQNESSEPRDSSLLQRWFDKDATEVLIGEDFWDAIGGAGASRAILEALHENEAYGETGIYR